MTLAIASLSPTANSVASVAGVSASSTTRPASKGKGKQTVTSTRFDYFPPSRRLLLNRSYVVYAGIQELVIESQQQAEPHHDGMDIEDSFAFTRARRNVLKSSGADVDLLINLSRAAASYVGHLTDYDQTLLERIRADPSLAAESIHTRSLARIFRLANLIYLPRDGLGDSVVGEELLEWINTVSTPARPSSAEIKSISTLAAPYEHAEFWTILEVALLRGLTNVGTALMESLTHYGEDTATRNRAVRIVELIGTRPRSSDARYPTTAHFLTAVRNWRSRVTKERKDVADLMRRGDEEDWAEANLRILDILLGDQDIIIEISETWQEATAAWCTLVAPGSTRDDLPTIISTITELMGPPDTTERIERIEMDLMTGNVSQAIVDMVDHDLWLATHVCDLLDKSGAMEDEPVREDRPKIRDWLVMRYADLLRCDSTLWKQQLDYLSSCGEIGRARMGQVLRNAPYIDEEPSAVVDDQQEERQMTRTPIAEVLLQCKLYGLEEDSRAICRRYAQHLVGQRRFGEAVSFALRANDVRRIARIADQLLEEYIVQGPIEFARLVDQIPTSVLHPEAPSLRPEYFGNNNEDDDDEHEDLGAGGLQGLSAADRAIVTSRLTFLARYRDFHALYTSGARSEAATLLVQMLTSLVAPRAFWAVLLLDAVPLLEDTTPHFSTHDTFELMRCLEEVVGPIAATSSRSDGSGSSGVRDSADALGPLGRIVTRHSLPPAAAKASSEGMRAWRLASAQKQVVNIRRALARNLARCATSMSL